MARINTDQPSSGKPLQLFIPDNFNSGFVDTNWFALAEAPDFSVPGTGDTGVVLDPADSGRELRPGEVFFESPLVVTNTTSTTRWVELRILLQGNSGQAIPVTPQIPVPASESVYLPIQGLRVLKTDLSNTEPGGRLQIRSEIDNALKVIGSAVELEALTHAPDSEAS